MTVIIYYDHRRLPEIHYDVVKMKVDAKRVFVKSRNVGVQVFHQEEYDIPSISRVEVRP